ncbi:phosphatidate cytidylyltransferase [uncultured Propionibacterium sp.]|uniref:phosphatidate cytidylyltransferase n=1 Tax=uncultured Propionibacterium sp. TaxID=218066 RepID=UPI002930EF9B|nr:phosphatidate cytidylyltransferase [uncultured Propionibacterium sp.]
MTSTDPTAADGRPVREHRTGRNLPVAITTGVVLGAIVIATLLWWHWGFAVFIVVALTAGVWEVCNAVERIGARPARWPILIGTPVLVLASYALFGAGERERAMGVIIGVLALMVVVCLLVRIPQGTRGFVKDAAASLFTIGYLPLLGSTCTLMLADDHGGSRVLCFLIAVIACDTGAFALGVMLGRHRMAPRVSPAKSWEGLAGGLVVALVAGALSVRLMLHAPLWVGALMGVVVGAIGALGDLVESAIKRDAGIKDMSHVLPGHGGAMDRLDSIVLSAPAAWFVMYLLVV